MSRSNFGRALLVLGTAVALLLPQAAQAQDNEFAEPLTALANVQPVKEPGQLPLACGSQRR